MNNIHQFGIKPTYSPGLVPSAPLYYSASPMDGQPHNAFSPGFSSDKIPPSEVAAYKRQSDGPILWFAAPPVNVTPVRGPVHSMEYLRYKNSR
ncbi:uncharacterized protein BYT42DRAFT_589920 [Radiomyces spectabilis]|uniref:uncharacterized protein n=1 Tax=Radiomyces spectabilis TaxID=64574 RepID=UPI002220507D|nr:uncharacterized protein BYT42DRAFT_589920 [Radiomyces spectabilis]KAI8364643.1 hypothetical protein BYT42DRAFT_589920 [Radiomyces spectabilis]